VLHGILRSGVLSSPAKMLAVVSDAARAMTTDTGFSSSDMLQIAESLRGLPSQDVQFVTAPNAPYPPDPAEVEFQQPQADALFSAIAHDSRLPSASGSNTSATTAGRVGVPDASPSRVSVQVLNGSAVAGIAGQVAAALTSRGFAVTGTGDAATFSYTGSVIEYASAAALPAVRTLKRQLISATIRRDSSLVPGTIDLIVGSSFRVLDPKPSHSSGRSSGESVTKLAQSDGSITGSATCRSDAEAFAGPLSPGG
jgi:LytR cell envelope-related transcriptional attenuator